MKPIKAYRCSILSLFLALAAFSSANATPPLVFPEAPSLPRIIQGEEGRALMAAGDRLYAEELGDTPADRYYLLRPGPALARAGATDHAARGSIYLGRAVLVSEGEPAVLRVEHARREIRPGDYLMPITGSRGSQDG